MRFDVRELPKSILTREGGSVKHTPEWNEANRLLQEAVRDAIYATPGWDRGADHSCHLSIVAFVGNKSGDGYYRPQAAHTLRDALEPVYSALKETGVIPDMRAVRALTTAVIEDSKTEGLQITIEPIQFGR